MPSKTGAAHIIARRLRNGLFHVIALAGVLVSAAAAQEARPTAAMLLDRLCNDTLRHNEEDRLFAMISITVRATIKYAAGVFDPDLMDDAMQDGLGAITAACPQIKAIDDPHRLGRAVELVRDATIKRMQNDKAPYSSRQLEKATAADLSQELSAQEIDAWLDGLPARRRALALLLYASDTSQRAMADAVGVPPAELTAGFRSVKTDLLRFLRADSDGVAAPAGGATMQYRVAGQSLAGLLKPGPAAAAAGAAEPAAPLRIRITGISSDVYAGWSLLATVTGLAPERSLELGDPILLEPDKPGRRRMIAVAAEEISDAKDNPRRFLLKAFAIDADREGAALGDGFHLGAPLDNTAALETLRSPSLAAIEIVRCLWHDYGTGPDPGLCR